MLKFLSGVVTQSAADTYTQAEIATGLANASLGYRVRQIVYSLPAPAEVDNEVEVQITRRSAAAGVTLGDRTLLHLVNRNVDLTTSGLVVTSRIFTFDFPKDMDLIIVEDPIFLACSSSGTSLANTARVRIYYEEVRLSETAKLAALTESLNA